MVGSADLIDHSENAPKLYAAPVVGRFGPDDREKLITDLQRIDVNTTTLPLAHKDELKLNLDGTLKSDRFLFTAAAFRQVAQIAAPGFSKFLPDVAGTAHIPKTREHLVDFELAVRTWNDIIDLRFPLLSSYRVIRNTEHSRVEGLLGSKHQYLENATLWDETQAAILEHRENVRFQAAMLVGRQLSIWFREPEAFFNTSAGSPPRSYFGGYYFANGEATGTAVRATHAVFSSDGVSLAPIDLYGCRLTHKGKEFATRLTVAIDEVFSTPFRYEAMAEAVERMNIRPLGFYRQWIKKVRDEYLSRIVRETSALGVIKPIAQDMVRSALYQGTEASPSLATAELGRLFAPRTLLDLYAGMLRVARQLDVFRQEQCAQAAFRVLSGDFFI